MKIEKIIHRNVLPDGTFSDKLGAVETKGKIIMSRGEGCGLGNCHCSDGYWLTIMMPLKNGSVHGIKVEFDDKNEQDLFLETHELINH